MRILILFGLSAWLNLGPTGTIFRRVSASHGRVERFGCFELSVKLDSFYTNAYDYSELALRCVFSGPGGRVDTVDGFYMTDCLIDTVTGKVSGGGEGHFAVRYSPHVAGRWSYRLFCETKAGRRWGPAGHFICVAGGDPGFVRTNGSPYLSFAHGPAFIPIGENMGWAQKNAYVDYRRWITRLVGHRGNFIRVWMPAWGLGLEWRKGFMGYQGLCQYQQTNAALLDWLFRFCAEKHVYVLLSLDHHGQVSSRVDPNWKDNPYNAMNGGPCEHTWDFFTDARARALIRNRFRYIVARYGYSSHILAWELFNEVDWTDDFRHHRADVAGWHAAMAAWLRRLDVNKHLITTSFGDARWDSLTWRLPGMDLTQTHCYTDGALDSVLAAGVGHYLSVYGKPTLNGEFGLATTGHGLAGVDPDGKYVHNALWATLLSGALGPGLPWYWDNYIDARNLYACFDGVAIFASQLDPARHGYKPATVVIAPGSVRAYALKSADATRLAGWLLNARYNERGGAQTAAGVTGAVRGGATGGATAGAAGAARGVDTAGAVRGAVLAAAGMRDGRYAVHWWDCRKGVIDAVDTVVVTKGLLRMSCPVISWDKAVTAERISGLPSGISKGFGHSGE